MSFELSGTVNLLENNSIKDLNKKNSDDTILSSRYQFVYASQLYNTFFGIFARFETSNLNHENKLCNVDAAEFILVNYSGQINLGIKSIDNIKLDEYSVPAYDGMPTELKCLNFDITIKGLEKGFKPEPKIFDKPITLSTKEEIYIRINRKVAPLIDGSNQPSFSDVIFDTEKYNRSGVFYNQKALLGKNNSNSDQRINLPDSTQIPKAPWGSCIPGYNKIVWTDSSL
ncbi:hypothetical protein [uncultured Aquimarina sp.]|uniref:hypothetical protein n=1 Tax=uncultured Aquimarina sp. TaxID=575652 RepID=UPI00263142EA|nr:hypothetical protein [uncultured Aquimarina sp.]